MLQLLARICDPRQVLYRFIDAGKPFFFLGVEGLELEEFEGLKTATNNLIKQHKDDEKEWEKGKGRR